MPDPPIAALKAQIWVRQGRLTEAFSWVRAQNLSPDDELSYMREFEHLTLARLLIAEKRITQALTLLDRLLPAAEAGRRTGSVLEILIVLALAHQARGDAPAALAALERALALAEPEGYVRIFVDEGEEMRSLMADCGREYSARLRIEKQGQRESSAIIEYTHDLLAAFVQPAAVPQSAIRQAEYSRPQSVMIEPLSERELDVLRLLGTELSGPEIADRLSVSLNTVRTHTKNIYGKLGVNSRRAAVRRAEEAGLL
jgi:LuxR family maltose regulon positive regulatory protein